MDEVARLAPSDRADLFRAAAETLGYSPAIVEKDFWVCWTLRRVFALPDPPADILFKGGTSLSKAFGVLDRFSEDIDLVLDRHGLGFTDERDPASPELSRKKRQSLIKELQHTCQTAVKDALLPRLRAEIAAALRDVPASSWRIELSPDDPDQQTIVFFYSTAAESIERGSPYIRPQVLLEIGARGDHWPAEERPIEPYAAKAVPAAFRSHGTTVHVLAAERTFWEKATILHSLHHKPLSDAIGPRLSRHYYDLVRLAASQFGANALQQPDLLRAVAAHKDQMFPAAWARYDLAVPGTLKLVPPPERHEKLAIDYKQMREMIFSDPPPFDELLRELQRLEDQINMAGPTSSAERVE